MKVALTAFTSAPLMGRLQLELETLLAAGYAVTVVYSQGDRFSESRDGRLKEVSLGLRGSKLRRLVSLASFYRRLYRELRRQEPDIVHCAHPLLLPPAIAYKRARRAKLVYDVFELYCMMWAARFPLGQNVWEKLFETIEERLASAADCILTVDSQAAKVESRYRRISPSVVALFNVPKLGTNVDEGLVADLREKYRGQRILIYVGSIEAMKGADLLIEAVGALRKDIPGLRLLLIGHTFEDEPWRSLVRQNAEFVEMIPTIAYDRMMAYLRIAEVGLASYLPTWQYPVLSRGNGRKIFTYMQAGLPIVGPEFGEIGIVISEERCGILVDTRSSSKIAEGVMQLLERPEWARELGERGRRAVEEKYNWDLEQNKLLAAYAELVEDHPASNPAVDECASLRAS